MITNLERIKRDIEALSKFNATPGNGLTRFSFTKEDRQAREYIKEEMKKVGLKIYEDEAATIVGRLEGQDKNAPVVMVGSHYDSVKNGGNFDGPAGVVTALEIARVMHENNQKPKFPIEFVAMIEEEGGRFSGGVFASRAMAGKVTQEELKTLRDDDGISMAEGMKAFGFNPEKIKEAIRKPETLKAFIELHIEQGPVLESKGKDIGIVEYIVGIKQLEVIIKGRPDHAGTTPMNMRADALHTATNAISKISNMAKKAGKGTVATVGILDISPRAANIVPGKVRFTVDIRSKSKACIELVSKEIDDLLKEVSNANGTQYTVYEVLNVAPSKLEESIIEKFHQYCDELELSKEVMLSGAGHDAMIMTDLTEVGLVFVPSKDGRSHCPEEWTDYEDLQKGIELVYKTVSDIAEVDHDEY